jgi:hypothetical protein
LKEYGGMAIYHLSVKTGSRSGGQSAKAKADYIQREGRYSRDRHEVLHAQSGNMPEWAERPGDYWDAADLYERANGRLFKEIEFALPVELTLDQQRELVEEFVRYLTDAERLPYTLAIHAGGGTNPHCHLMISERMNDGIRRPREQWFKRYNARHPAQGGARKTERLKPKSWLEDTRKVWAQLANAALERAGYDERIDARSLADQGIERVPQIHLGPNVVEMEVKGIRTERADIALAIDMTNDKIIDLQKYREVIKHECDRQSKTSERDRRAGRADRAVRSEHGGTGGRSQRADRRVAADQRGAGRKMDETAAENHGRMAEGSQGDECSSRGIDCRKSGSPKSRTWLDVAAMGWSLDRFRDAYSGPADRIVALARRTLSDNGGRDDMATTTHTMKGDRTAQAVRRQLGAMGCKRFDIGIRDAASGAMMQREWTADEVLKNLSWLKRMNARGNDIYVRPAADEPHGLVLVDDLSFDDLDSMVRDGCEPAVIVETSPANYQAWVKVGQRVAAAVRGAIARLLARRYEADPASADARHYGRLAGFTNRKDKYSNRYGLQPWVLCCASSGTTASASADLIAQAQGELERIERAREQAARLENIKSAAQQQGRDVVSEYRREMESLLRRFDDISRCDFIAAMNLACKGWTPEEIGRAMAEASPAIMERKAGHEADYIKRTVQKVMELPRVQEARAELARKAQSNRGPGLRM